MNQELMEYFKNYNIWFLGIMLLLQSIGIPTGGTLLVIASGAFAYAGEFNLFVVLIQVWILVCIGDSMAYVIWKLIGHKLLKKFPKINNYVEPKLLKAHDYLQKHGKGAVFYTRFLISAMGPFINAAAGIAEYQWLHFVTYVVLGEFIWTCIYIGLGYWFGDSWENLIPILSQVSQLLIFGGVLVVSIYFFIKILKKK